MCVWSNQSALFSNLVVKWLKTICQTVLCLDCCKSVFFNPGLKHPQSETCCCKWYEFVQVTIMLWWVLTVGIVFQSSVLYKPLTFHMVVLLWNTAAMDGEGLLSIYICISCVYCNVGTYRGTFMNQNGMCTILEVGAMICPYFLILWNISRLPKKKIYLS